MDYKLGDKIQVYPLLMPDEEKSRQKQLGGTVEQKQHQLNSDPGVIEGITKMADGIRYLVRVFIPNKPQGALRYYNEDKAKAQFKAK